MAREFHFNEIILIPMEQRIFTISLIIEGATEKVLQFQMPLKSIYNKNTWFHLTKNVILNTTKRFKQ
jgi:hypothetical protein